MFKQEILAQADALPGGASGNFLNLVSGVYLAIKASIQKNVLTQANKAEFRKEALDLFDTVIVPNDGIPDAYDQIIRPSYEAAVDRSLNILIPVQS